MSENDATSSRGITPVRLWIDDLMKKLRDFPDDLYADNGGRNFTLGLGVVNHYLGEDWIERHIGPQSLPSGYLRAQFYSLTAKAHIQAWRTVDLGEMLFNLQYLEGFDERIAEMKPRTPESYIAEFQVAKMIFINGWHFSFVKQSMRRGLDYDFEIQSAHGHTICAEAKCKIEATPLSAETIETTLQDSRTQLPSDRPGVFFVKIPQTWITEPDWERITIEGANRFFSHGTGRVVSVVFYAEPLTFANGVLTRSHRFKEVANPRHRFGTEKDWRLLSRWMPPEDNWTKMPPHWFQLIFMTRDGYAPVER